jgi:PKD repeat protein
VQSYGVNESAGFDLKTLNVIYCIRIGLGVLAALIATLVVDLKVGNPLINGITVALAVYLLTYYLLKMVFANKVEKPTKILTMGIGIYFIIFVFCWVLFTTPLLAPPTAMITRTPNSEYVVVGEQITFDASASFDPDGDIVKYSWKFGDGTTETGETLNYTYAKAGNYTVSLTVVDEHGISITNTTTITVKAPA